MRSFIFAAAMITILFCTLVNSTPVKAQDDGNWVKYVTWKGQVEDMLILRIFNNTVNAIDPVESGYRYPSFTFFADAPQSDCLAKIDVVKSRGTVAIRKQYWQSPDRSIRIQIYDKEPGYGDYEFTVYYKIGTFTAKEKADYQKDVDKAVYDYDIYHMQKSRNENNLIDALRWARSAYEIDRLNWDILNTIGELYYLTAKKDKAEDVFIILRDYGYLTKENIERFKEVNPYEASKAPKSNEGTGGEKEEELEGPTGEPETPSQG